MVLAESKDLEADLSLFFALVTMSVIRWCSGGVFPGVHRDLSRSEDSELNDFLIYYLCLHRYQCPEIPDIPGEVRSSHGGSGGQRCSR